MLPLLGTMTIALASIAPSPSPAAPVIAQTAPAATSISAPAVSRRHQSVQAAVSQPSSSDDAALDEQYRMRVLLPPLSGDGGA